MGQRLQQTINHYVRFSVVTQRQIGINSVLITSAHLPTLNIPLGLKIGDYFMGSSLRDPDVV
jgi:hypothetical protein